MKHAGAQLKKEAFLNTKKMFYIVLAAALLVSMLLVFWKIIYFTFIQDDWELIWLFQFNDFGTVLNKAFIPNERFFFSSLWSILFVWIVFLV